ncbi:hypothetical protein D3C75_327520 [compost metagenome]
MYMKIYHNDTWDFWEQERKEIRRLELAKEREAEQLEQIAAMRDSFTTPKAAKNDAWAVKKIGSSRKNNNHAKAKRKAQRKARKSK